MMRKETIVITKVLPVLLYSKRNNDCPLHGMNDSNITGSSSVANMFWWRAVYHSPHNML